MEKEGEGRMKIRIEKMKQIEEAKLEEDEEVEKVKMEEKAMEERRKRRS